MIPPGRGKAILYYITVVLEYEGDECLIWPFYRNINGYAVMQSKLVHNLICHKVHGPPPTPRHQAAHSCKRGRQGCVTQGHIRWKTGSENCLEKEPRFSEEQIRAILNDPRSSRKAAPDYGVKYGTILRIRRRLP